MFSVRPLSTGAMRPPSPTFRPAGPVSFLTLAALSLALGCLAVGPPPLGGQSIVRGDLEGVVRAADGRALENVAVTVTGVGSATVVETETERGGTYRLSLLQPGRYDVRVEALGYLPLLVRDVRVAAGSTVRVATELEPAPPPVETVDTVYLGAAGDARLDREGARRLSRSEIEAFPDRRMAIGGLATLSTLLDEALGSEGLPGSMSRVVLDGVPFTPASHPLQRSGGGELPLLPRLGLEGLDVHRGTDVEWTGAAGSYVSATSRSAWPEPAGELFGAGSAGPLWQTEPFSGRSEPAMTSGWAGGAAHLPLADESAQLFAGVEGTYLRTPRPSPVPEAVATRLLEARPPGGGIEAGDLSDAWLDDLRAVSGLTRLDWTTGGSEVMARAGFSSLRNEGGRFFAPTLEYASPAPVEGTDVYGSVSMLTEVHSMVTLEIRGGFERSARLWQGTRASDPNASLPATRLSEGGALLGPDPGLAGEVTRTAFLGGPTAHVRWREHRVKAGVAVSVPSYRYDHVHRSAGEFVFGTPERISGGEGLFQRAVGTAPSRTFSVPELGAFLQHLWEPVAGIRLTTGIRYDREAMPSDRIPPNQRWAQLTGLRNDALPSALDKISPRVAAAWDLAGNGRTMLHGAVGTHYQPMDPAALNELLSLSGSVRHLRRIGGLGAWPDLPGPDPAAPEAGITLALPGPDLEAPSTGRATLGLTQRLGEGTALHASGTLRRTRSILRRSDLNLALRPSRSSPDGRPVHGTLVKMGSVVAAEPGTNRRFPEFDHVWALNADGWSEYRGATVGFEHAAAAEWELFASYTFSVTEDNLVGAASGLPDAELRPRLGDAGPVDWDEGTSDFDVPHRLAAGVVARLPLLEGAELAGVYRFRSGRPFTAGYRAGVDVTGDGSGHNDPAHVGGLGSVHAPCVAPDQGRIARRNGCRGAGVHSVDLHLAVNLLTLGASSAGLTLDLFNLTDAELGSPDRALYLVNDAHPLGIDPATGETAIPFEPNPGFGDVLHPVRPGRMARIGFRVTLP